MVSATRISSVLVMVVLAAGACGSAQRGELDGAIRFSGGPAGAVFAQRQGGHVRLSRAHDVVVRVQVRPGHGFRLSAPPGDYRLEGRSGDALCRARTVTLHAGTPAHADLVCDVR